MPTIDWAPLRKALHHCRGSGTLPQFWWRDDDAIEPSAALDTLADLTNRLGTSVHLAVIPALADETLVTFCRDAPMIPVVHGWAHTNHGQGAEKKNEFLTPRSDAIAEAARGLRHMKTLFGNGVAKMFVPPWNRIHPTVTQSLPIAGYTTVSTFGPRHAPLATPDLLQINTHVDPIDWKDTRGLIAPDILIQSASAQLTARATGTADATEPFGLLTHHLVHDQAVWDFCRAFVTEMLSGGAQPWILETAS